MVNKQRFRRELLAWYNQNKRHLPWRDETDPYKIWVSEIILQQTQVKQGMAYYLRFIETFPNVGSLAAAREDRVLKMWQGLGYYSRARNLHAAARMVMKEFAGKFPRSYNDIIRLKGVGEYTAAAISSFAFNEKQAVVDGNVYRLLSRLFGIQKAVDSSEGKKAFASLAKELIDEKYPGDYNQAIMEFGSQHCRLHEPFCNSCVFSDDCFAYRNNRIKQLPVKSKKTKISERHFNYVVRVYRDKKLAIHKRKDKDIWKGLYEFELHETAQEAEPTDFLARLKKKRGEKFSVLHVSQIYKHVLSHRIILARFYVILSNKRHSGPGLAVTAQSLTKFAFPRLTEKFLSGCNLNDLF